MLFELLDVVVSKNVPVKKRKGYLFYAIFQNSWKEHDDASFSPPIASFLFSHLKSRKDFSLSLLRMDDVSIDEGTGNHVANLLVQHERELTFTNLILCISQNILISE